MWVSGHKTEEAHFPLPLFPPCQLSQLEAAALREQAGQEDEDGQQHPSAVTRNGDGSWGYDAALRHLKGLSDEGRLGGRLYGRLCNTARVLEEAMAAPVNAVLQVDPGSGSADSHTNGGTDSHANGGDGHTRQCCAAGGPGVRVCR